MSTKILIVGSATSVEMMNCLTKFIENYVRPDLECSVVISLDLAIAKMNERPNIIIILNNWTFGEDCLPEEIGVVVQDSDDMGRALFRFIRRQGEWGSDVLVVILSRNRSTKIESHKVMAVDIGSEAQGFSQTIEFLRENLL